MSISNDIHVTVKSGEEAACLQSDFDELVTRVNADMMFVSMQPEDPISVEAAIIAAEQSIERHLLEFEANSSLQLLQGELAQRFRRAIYEQAKGSQTS